MSDLNKTAFALGGLAGNNAHGAGFLQAAFDLNVDPHFISCTSGQIFWVYKYLTGDKTDGFLRKVMADEISKSEPFKNKTLDWLTLAFSGREGVFKPAMGEYVSDLAQNYLKLCKRSLSSPADIWWMQELAGLSPARSLVPSFPADLFKSMATVFNASDTGIAFNSYEPGSGMEYVYLNSTAMTALSVADGEKSKYREQTVYRKITAEGIQEGLWIYQYGFGEGISSLDGAYYRQIILSELVGADEIFVVRPVNRKWIGPLPTNRIELEDLKTEVGFNGCYIGERDKIMMINHLIAKGALQSPAYHNISLTEVEIETQEGYFDYVFEELSVFDDSYNKSLIALS